MLTLLLQVLMTSRYYASSSFQGVCGELIGISALTNLIECDTIINQRGSLTSLLQVLMIQRYCASSSFQDVCGELTGISDLTNLIECDIMVTNRKRRSNTFVASTRDFTIFCIIKFPRCLWGANCNRPINCVTSCV
jgi:xanthine/uracil/vitamin C permease (AzgA family)